MTREIKFRAWNETTEMVYPNFPKGNLTSADILARYGTVMQFTGLKDKNGKEIYEGDIIVWEKGTEGTWSGQDRPKEVKYPFICGNADLGEIIGNIYENPELLT